MVSKEENQDNVIYFYETFDGLSKPEHRYLNNFQESPLVSASGLTFLSVEHYYQAHKFGDFSKEGFKEKFEEIRTAEDPDKCKKAARRLTKELDDKVWDKEGWDAKYKEYYMRRGLVFKFSQNKDMLAKLLETGDKVLKEESKKDMYWGGLLEGSKNRLGELLMELRDNYKKTKTVFIEGSNLEPIPVKLE